MILYSKIKIQLIACGVKGLLIWAGFPPIFFNFQISNISPACWVSPLSYSPAKWLGVTRALVVGLYTLKEVKKCVQRCLKLKMGFATQKTGSSSILVSHSQTNPEAAILVSQTAEFKSQSVAH